MDKNISNAGSKYGGVGTPVYDPSSQMLKDAKIVLPAQQMMLYTNMVADMIKVGGFTEDQIYKLVSAVPLAKMNSQKGAFTVTDTALGNAYLRHFQYNHESAEDATNNALNDVKKEKSAPQYKNPFLKVLDHPLTRIAASVGIVTGLAKLVNSTPMPYGSVDNGEVQYNWDINMDSGYASLQISNIGTTPLTEFKLNIAEMLGYSTDPDVWHLNPDSGTAKFSIGGGELGLGDSFQIDYLFNKDLVELTFDKLGYSGDSIGTLDDIVTVSNIPEPATIGTLAFGAALLALARKRK